tara:strand:+ start:1336 stop:2187 length:852 start_codon:yes stop_codon:yes gene_type:complete
MEIYILVTLCIVVLIYVMRNGPTMAGIVAGYKVWTYIEDPSYKQIQLYDNPGKSPVFFRKCIEKMKKFTNNLVVLTPQNIHNYVPEFPIKMSPNSEYSLKKRVDLLFAFILEKYGGLCLSPGTIVYDLNHIFSKTYYHDLVSVGGSPEVIQASFSHLYPNNYVIGSKKNSHFIKSYKHELLNNFDSVAIRSYQSLSKLIQLYKPNQYHYGTVHDGTMNKNMKLVTVQDFLGDEPIEFLDKEKLYVISFPYDILLKRSEYGWFLNLSEKQFLQSNLQARVLLKT